MSRSVFSSSEAKGYIRDEFDFNLIKRFKDEHYPNADLAYVGLPGEDLLDIISWRSFIGRWTAVQVTGSPALEDAADNLVANALKHRLERGFNIIRGNIDQLFRARSPKLKWPYQIVNLDYVGGLLGASDRLPAISELFSQQDGTAFILLLTLNLRDRDGGELEQTVSEEQEELKALGISGVDEVFTSHREFGHAGLLKIYVPLTLANMANRHSLSFGLPILYQGTKQMIHFAVICTPYLERKAGRTLRVSERVDLLNLPLGLLHRRDDLRKMQLGSLSLDSASQGAE
ncbi:MAG TPA: hypothetical protein VHE55_05250 [Fimbriimonadaceae bacterium]|nr:hypothetical protein [Fimbriimonadaceae bacterium]